MRKAQAQNWQPHNFDFVVVFETEACSSLALAKCGSSITYLHILEKVARYFQTFMQAQILLFRCHELERKNSKLNVKMNSKSKDSFSLAVFFHLDENPT